MRSLMPMFSGSLSTDTTLHVACQGLHESPVPLFFFPPTQFLFSFTLAYPSHLQYTSFRYLSCVEFLCTDVCLDFSLPEKPEGDDYRRSTYSWKPLLWIRPLGLGWSLGGPWSPFLGTVPADALTDHDHATTTVWFPVK